MNKIDKNVFEEIQEELKLIEKENDVIIFYACESGSRAWGFESTDSDYDVRFLYVHKLDWYLSIEDKRDVIERPITDELDISGWEIGKALKLLRKSNPPFLEWMQSPIVYKNIEEITQQIKDVLPNYYSPRNCRYHYFSMASSNFREYLKREEVWLKKYFYVLRPLLACRWIDSFLEPVPVEFSKLLAKTVDDSLLLKDIDELLMRKKSGDELAAGPQIPSISSFIESEINRLEKNEAKQAQYSDYLELNEVFRNIVKGIK